MNGTNIFEVATRLKFKFPFKGSISVEDLWDLSVQDLDFIFKKLNSEIKQTKEESLLKNKSAEDAILDMKIEIVKHIVNVKLEEAENKKKEKDIKDKKQKIMGIIAAKEDEELHNMSKEELTKMLDELTM